MATKRHLLFIIFLFSFLWMLSLTANFGFFWDDIYVINRYYSIQNGDYDLPKISSLFLNTLINKEQFTHISYMWRPLEEVIYLFIPFILKVNIITYRIMKSLLYALFISLCFYFLYHLRDHTVFNKTLSLRSKINTLTVSLLMIGYIMVLPEFWLLIVIFADTIIITLIFTTIALLLFYFFYNDENITNKITVFFLGISIIFFTQLSILTKQIGRINFLVIFFFLLFTNRKKLLTFRYAILIILLFFLSYPLGTIPKILSGENLFTVLGINIHFTRDLGIQDTDSALSPFKFFKMLYFSFSPPAFFLFWLLVLFVILHTFSLLTKKEKSRSSETDHLKSFTIFTFMWYFSSAIIFYIARGTFIFPLKDVMRFEFVIFLVPQLLFVISYCYFVYKSYFNKYHIMTYIIIVFLLLALLHNVIRLNEWRGGWGAYFLGYDTARQYVDEHADNALLVLPYNHASPLYFINNTNTYILESDITNSTRLHNYLQNYSAVFIVSRETIHYTDPTIINIVNLTINDISPYGMLKKMLGRYYKEPMYFYQVHPS